MKNNRINREKLTAIIKDILIDNQENISGDDEEIISRRASDLLSKSPNFIDSSSLDSTDLDTYYYFTMWSNRDINEFLETFEHVDTNYNNTYLVFFTNSMEDSLKLEKKVKDLKVRKAIINKISGVESVKELQYEIILFNSKENNSFEIKIDSRIRSLENFRTVKDNDNELSISGYVFTASLYDITQIYNLLGNELFKSNIRFGIKDKLDVDYEIKRTMNEFPEEFWFLNNGITIIVSDNKFCIKKTNVLELSHGNNSNISVINGAQTITASTKFFYEDDPNDLDKKSQERIEQAKVDSKVLLRLIHIENIDAKTRELCNKEIDKISLALNRQKPIEPEDIAYTTPFVYTLNSLEEKGLIDFSLTRRGETKKGGHSIVDFARATKAYLAQTPGNARSTGKKTILKIETTKRGYEFKDKDIFKQDNIENEADMINTYNRYYKPVNFALELEKYYSHRAKYLKKNIDDAEDIINKKKIATINYGKWHFIAYLIFALNGCKSDDYSNFSISLSDISDQTKDDIIEEFIEMFVKSTTDFHEIDSNDFKTQTLYDNFITSDYSNHFKVFLLTKLDISNGLDEVAVTTG